MQCYVGTVACNGYKLNRRTRLVAFSKQKNKLLALACWAEQTSSKVQVSRQLGLPPAQATRNGTGIASCMRWTNRNCWIGEQETNSNGFQSCPCVIFTICRHVARMAPHASDLSLLAMFTENRNGYRKQFYLLGLLFQATRTSIFMSLNCKHRRKPCHKRLYQLSNNSTSVGRRILWINYTQ